MVNESQRIQESSQYLATLLRGRPHYRDWLLAEKNLHRRYPLTELYEDLQGSVCQVKTFGGLLAAFREFKQRHFLRIGGRDLLAWADLPETTGQISDLAAVALQIGLEVLSRHPDWWLAEEEWDGWVRVQEDTQLVIMGLGKLGGHELNYVSDVDLLFLHEPKGGSAVAVPSAGMLYDRLGQWLSRLLAESVDGDRVFQVDHRLRPHGKDGPLVPSCSGAADYYLETGRPWERQMLIKARPVAGDRSLGAAFLREVRPFVFRRFLDFQALDELRAMRDRILNETTRHQSGWDQFDVKLGVGGIREVEFLVQSLQLIYGGRHPELDEPNTLRCLDRLSQLDLLERPVVEELKASYTFLRRVEHWVQLDQNRQTQKLPRTPEARTRLALALGFDGDERVFLEQLAACCRLVHLHFLALFGADSGERREYERDDEDSASQARSARSGFSLEAFPREPLTRFRNTLRAFPPTLERTIEEALSTCPLAGERDLQETLLIRLDRYFSQVARRPGLTQVFRTTKPWLADFCRGLATTELLATLLSHHPGLVEGVATASDICREFAAWEKAGLRLLRRTEDYGESLEWIRRLRNERLLQLVLADLRGDFTCEGLEVELSRLADFVIQQTYERVRANLALPLELPLAVLALGRLGSREMSYLSDLDLVFVYRSGPGEADDLIPGEVVRLVQRFMRMLSTPLHEGPGYEVDARLRPTGNYGPLIVTRSAWLDYYRHQADLWEIQALLRARYVAGNTELGTWLEEQVREICYQQRAATEVWARLCHLRRRMERERAEERGDQLDIKLGKGGLTDLEFLAQGWALTDGYRLPALQARSVRAGLGAVLEHASVLPEAAGRVRQEQASTLPHATLPDAAPGGAHEPFATCQSEPREVMAVFEALRALAHRLRLHTNLASSRLTRETFEVMHKLQLWPPAHCGHTIETWQDLIRLRRRVRNALQGFCPDL